MTRESASTLTAATTSASTSSRNEPMHTSEDNNAQLLPKFIKNEPTILLPTLDLDEFVNDNETKPAIAELNGHDEELGEDLLDAVDHEFATERILAESDQATFFKMISKKARAIVALGSYSFLSRSFMDLLADNYDHVDLDMDTLENLENLVNKKYENDEAQRLEAAKERERTQTEEEEGVTRVKDEPVEFEETDYTFEPEIKQEPNGN